MKMFDCAHTLMTKVIEYYYHKGPRTCWQTWYPKADGYWDGDALVWGQGSGLSAFVAMREASLGTGQERHYEALDNDMFSGMGWASRGDGVQGLAVGAATSLGRAVAVASMGSVRTPLTTAAVWESP